jgi:hypothetical protein
MPNSNLPEPELLKTLLEPLLGDFQYWFGGARSRLEQSEIHFLGPEKQAGLLERVKQAQQKVDATQSLFKATNGQVGIEAAILMTWHQLVAECWQMMSRFRAEESTKNQPEI